MTAAREASRRCCQQGLEIALALMGSIPRAVNPCDDTGASLLHAIRWAKSFCLLLWTRIFGRGRVVAERLLIEGEVGLLDDGVGDFRRLRLVGGVALADHAPDGAGAQFAEQMLIAINDLPARHAPRREIELAQIAPGDHQMLAPEAQAQPAFIDGEGRPGEICLAMGE